MMITESCCRPSRLLLYTGILTVGVGDAMVSFYDVAIYGIGELITRTQASVVGKRVGRYKWSPTTPKTLEGSAGFTISVVASAWALRVCGLVEDFSRSE